MSKGERIKAPVLRADDAGGRAFDRRTILKGAAALPVAALLADPVRAQEVAETLTTVSLTTHGGQEVSATIALPETLPAPCVLLIHEWWGLNDYVKTMASAFADAGYIALAVDLYKGVVATDAATAGYTMRNVDAAEATDTLTSWMAWLRNREDTTDRLGVCGWCFGGSWSLNASLAAPADATVIYYGNVEKNAVELAPLKGPVLGHFGTRDTRINEDMVGRFEKALKEAEKSASIHWYEADHAFANPTTARYDEDDAKLAWERTLAFFGEHLK